MSQFDVAAGITQQAINNLIHTLFDNQAVRSRILQVETTQTLEDLGEFKLNATVNEAPVIDLALPTADEWKKSVKAAGAVKPSVNGLKLSFPSATGSMEYEDIKTTATGPVILLGEVVTANKETKFKVIAVLLDEKDFSELDAELVNQQLIPVFLDMANDLLASVTIPAIPTIEKVVFQPLVVKIVNSMLVLAVSIEGSPATNVDDYHAPAESTTGIFTELSNIVPNALLNSLVKGQTFDAKATTGDKEWSAECAASVKVADLSVDFSDKKITAKLTPEDLKARGGVGGLGVGITKSVICPVAAAIDAMVDPNNWDRIDASFVIHIDPATVTADAKGELKKKDKENQKLKLTVNSVNNFTIAAMPTWSDVIGSTLAFAASFVINSVATLLTLILKDKIIDAYLNNLEVYEIPEVSKEIAGLRVALAMPDNAITISVNKTIVQDFKVTVN